MENMKKLEEIKEEIKSNLSDYSLDFANCYDFESNEYISDAISEFADSNTSIYYADQRKFYYENTDLCENALLEYGYDLNELIKDGNTLDDLICKAGAIGEYAYIQQTINGELEDVLKLILINYIIENNIECDIDILDNINIYQLDYFSDLLDLIEEYTKEEEKEE